MDIKTLEAYERSAATIADSYEMADMSNLHRIFVRHLPPRSSVLEVGCGSGRDADFLFRNGFDVTAVDASPSMIAEAAKRHTDMAPRFFIAAAPFESDCPLLRLRYSAILMIALVMHLTDAELLRIAGQFHGILNYGGILLVSASQGRDEIMDQRDLTGRLYIERSTTKLDEVFNGAGFKRIASYRNRDSLYRPVKWVTLLYKKDSDAIT